MPHHRFAARVSAVALFSSQRLLSTGSRTRGKQLSGSPAAPVQTSWKLPLFAAAGAFAVTSGLAWVVWLNSTDPLPKNKVMP
jgi:hypothetical protein